MDFENIIKQLDSDQTQDLLGACVAALSVDQINNTLQAWLSKVDMVELGERLIEAGSAA